METKQDSDGFKKTGRILAKAMLEGGSDDFKKTGCIITKAMLEGGCEVWLGTNKLRQQIRNKYGKAGIRSPTHRSYCMSDCQNR